MRRPARIVSFLGVLASTMTLSQTVRADAQQCVVASEKAQQLKNAGKLAEAREQLVICQSPDCPKLIQNDCSQWMSQLVNELLPSIIPGARDKRGRDLVDVRVTVDGKLFADRLDGKPIALDPGVHTIRFETKGASAVEEQVVVKQGEKNRIYTVTLAIGENASAAAPTPTPEEPRGRSSPPILGYALGGAGVVAGGIALYILLDSNGDATNLRETCAPQCDQKDVDDIEQRRVIAGVTGGVGAALLIAGLVLVLTHKGGDTGKIQPSTFVAAPGGGGAVFRF